MDELGRSLVIEKFEYFITLSGQVNQEIEIFEANMKEVGRERACALT